MSAAIRLRLMRVWWIGAAMVWACQPRPPAGVVDVSKTGPEAFAKTTTAAAVCFAPAETIVNDPRLSSEVHTMRMLGAVSYDGSPAIVTARNERVTVRVSDETGRFSVVQQILLPLGDTQPEEVMLADMDGNGHADAVSSDRKSLWVAQGSAKGFRKATKIANLDGVDKSHWLAGRVDADGDGRAELIYSKSDHSSDPTQRSFELYRVDGQLHHVQTIFEKSTADNVTTGDLDGDGRMDVVTSSSAGARTIRFALNNGHGFDSAEQVPTGKKDQWHRDVLIGDFDGDGDNDMAATGSGNEVVHLRNDDGSFAPTATFQLEGIGIRAAAGDFDGDGITDLSVLLNGPAGKYAPRDRHDGGRAVRVARASLRDRRLQVGCHREDLKAYRGPRSKFAQQLAAAEQTARAAAQKSRTSVSIR